MREDWTYDRLREAVESALARIDRDGRRGLTRVTEHEIEAMAMTIVLTGAVERLMMHEGGKG